jgi:hypothetical protein
MKTYIVRYLPIQWTRERPGAIEIIVRASNEHEAKQHIPERYNSALVFETEAV